MFAKFSILLLLAVGLSQAEIKYLPDGGLLQFMMQSRDLSQGNPECFVYYAPVLSDIINQYQKDYELCLAVAEESRENIDDKTASNRTEIDQSAANACQITQSCSAEKSALEYFACYADAGSDNAKSMYTISANSAELLAEVKEDYRLIQIDEFACTNKSERAYVENTAATYDELDKCLKGLAPVPTASPAQTESTVPTSGPTDSTSSAPESSTSAPESSTRAPESSTSAPEPSTSDPESSSSAPDSSTSVPESSSSAPESSTSAPESSTGIPESSSSAPESSTSVPESSSSAPDSSTSVPESSSSAPESSTSVPESSSSAPESSTQEDSSSSTEEPIESSSTAGNRDQYPEEDLPLANSEIKSIIDNLKNWLKRH